MTMRGGSSLFEPMLMRGVTLRNRVGVSPMCQYSSVDGFANDWHLVHLGSRAVGGAGLVMMEATAVSPEGRISPVDLGIYSNAHVDMIARCVRFIENQGAVAGMQLAHAGRKASVVPPWEGGHYLDVSEGGWRPIYAPSPIPFREGAPVPQELDTDGIHSVISDFRAATLRAVDAGFRVLEIHAAHGYLLDEFLSPISNHRTDEYGGSFENRIRFVVEVTRAIREDWPERFPLFMRISATDWLEGGWNIEQSIELARVLKTLGVDLIDCSSGGIAPGAHIPAEPGYQVGFAEKIRREAEIATAGVGLITDEAHADEIIRSGQADIVFLARQMLRDPYWAAHAAKKLGVSSHPWPVQYQRAAD
jgi:2,4-dienoyl-CoA reductase-like NADH-dependent reductase (Old Yellow Enzyme family)